MPNPSLREQLEEALATPSPESEDASESASGVTLSEAPPAQEEPSQEEQTSQEETSQEEAPQETQETQEDAYASAPASWRPAAREHWNDLPAPIREEIYRRESNINEGLQEASDARKMHTELAPLLDRYQPLMLAENVQTPAELIDRTLGFVNLMRNGTPTQRAEAIATLVTSYQVPLETLDSTLAQALGGEPSASAPGGQSGDLERLLDERLAPITRFMQGFQTQAQEHQRSAEAQASQEIERFQAQAEFLEDVRLDMADLLDLASRRGREMTLEQAYDQACRAHPEVSKVLMEREAKQGIAQQQSHVAAKEALARTTLRTTAPTASGAEAQSQTNGSIRGALQAAFNEHSE